MSRIRLEPWNEPFKMEMKESEKQFVPLCLG